MNHVDFSKILLGSATRHVRSRLQLSIVCIGNSPRAPTGVRRLARLKGLSPSVAALGTPTAKDVLPRHRCG